MSHISIHAPREGSDDQFVGHAPVTDISIHAPREGSDQCQGLVERIRAEFQSTLPVRGATTNNTELGGICLFQSTLPVRGATNSKAEGQKNREISIHAPREGSDPKRNHKILAFPIFQSTLPVRGATRDRLTHIDN